MNEMYQTMYSSSNPGLIIFLIDGTENTAKAVNRIIETIICINFDGKKPKNRCYITVIGCDFEPKIITTGYLQEFEANPFHINEVTKKVSDGAGGYVFIKSKMPVWIDPTYKGRWRNTIGAFHLAKEIVEAWIGDKPESPAPIIVNITDREPNFDEKEIAGSINVVNAIKNLDTNDGKIRIINAILGDEEEVLFPNSHIVLTSEQTKFLYEISTKILDNYCERMDSCFDIPIELGSKCFVYNTDITFIESLIKIYMFDIKSKFDGHSCLMDK